MFGQKSIIWILLPTTVNIFLRTFGTPALEN